MNKARRKVIDKALQNLADLLLILQEVKEDEETAFENMPESLQEGEQGEKMQACIENLDEGVSALESAIEAFTAAQE